MGLRTLLTRLTGTRTAARPASAAAEHEAARAAQRSAGRAGSATAYEGLRDQGRG